MQVERLSIQPLQNLKLCIYVYTDDFVSNQKGSIFYQNLCAYGIRGGPNEKKVDQKNKVDQKKKSSMKKFICLVYKKNLLELFFSGPLSFLVHFFLFDPLRMPDVPLDTLHI